MNVYIHRPTGKETMTVSWLEIDTDVGNFVIKRGHAPMILALAPQKPITVLLTNGKQEMIGVTRGGMVEVQRADVKIYLHE